MPKPYPCFDARQYNERQDEVPSTLVDTIMKKIAKGALLTADLQDGYNFPSHITCTDLRPDIVWRDDGKREVTLVRVNHSFRYHFGGGSLEEER